MQPKVRCGHFAVRALAERYSFAQLAGFIASIALAASSAVFAQSPGAVASATGSRPKIVLLFAAGCVDEPRQRALCELGAAYHTRESRVRCADGAMQAVQAFMAPAPKS